jgi:NADH-quinone oxidoreductase subunit F
VDLLHLDTPPSDDERAAVDGVLGPADPAAAPSFTAAKRLRRMLLPALHALQDRVGTISEGGLGYVCRRLHVAPAEAYGVATFYALYHVGGHAPRTVLHVCDDVACRLYGGHQLAEALEGRPLPAGAGIERSPCLGMCEQAPAVLMLHADQRPLAAAWGNADPVGVRAAMSTLRPPPRGPAVIRQPVEELHLLKRVGRVDPTSMEDYLAHGGFQALRRALELGPAAVIAQVSESGLVGRGGAAFPTGRKWDAVAKNPRRPHHLVCNADESEPGTFKDRVLMEDDPFAVLEGVAIAAFAVGCERAIIYLRGEYPLARERLEGAIAACRAAGWLGPSVGGKAAIDIELFRGAGAYICGEETALLNSLEGLRGEPRQKPPFPSDAGYFGEPTAINNVETLVNVLDILVDGPATWAARGVPGAPGTRLFCLSGHIRDPGIYEVPMGTTLGELLAKAGGWHRPYRAVLLGGAAGSFVRGDALDLPLTFEATRKAGTTLGSGVVLPVDDRADLVGLLKRVALFFRDESCGQCVPCRVGTVRMEEWLTRQSAGRDLGTPEQEASRLADLAQVMKDASICGLGQTAASAIESAARLGLLRETP